MSELRSSVTNFLTAASVALSLTAVPKPAEAGLAKPHDAPLSQLENPAVAIACLKKLNGRIYDPMTQKQSDRAQYGGLECAVIKYADGSGSFARIGIQTFDKNGKPLEARGEPVYKNEISVGNHTSEIVFRTDKTIVSMDGSTPNEAIVAPVSNKMVSGKTIAADQLSPGLKAEAEKLSASAGIVKAGFLKPHNAKAKSRLTPTGPG